MDTFSEKSKYRQSLEEAIEELYAVFAKYPLAEEIKGCTHCVFEEDHARLRSRSLRRLRASDLSKYAWKAMTTWGKVSDFKHFLPRLLELQAYNTGPREWRCSWILMDKLDHADWRSWPAREQKAIGVYLSALWHFLLSIRRRGMTGIEFTVIDFLESLEHLKVGPEQYVDIWRKDRSAIGMRHLADAILETTYVHRNCSNALRQAHCRNLLNSPTWAWVFEPATKETLEVGLSIYRDQPFAVRIEAAMKAIERTRAISQQAL